MTKVLMKVTSAAATALCLLVLSRTPLAAAKVTLELKPKFAWAGESVILAVEVSNPPVA